MTNLKILVLVAAILFQTTSAQAKGPSCKGLFAEAEPSGGTLFSKDTTLRSLKLVDTPLPSRTSDPNFKVALVDLLDMYINVLFQKNLKDPFKDGELLFARSIGNGETVEFEYTVDQRPGTDAYKLSKVTLVKQNGQRATLDKNPTSDSGRDLNRAAYSLVTSRNETKVLEKSDLISKAKTQPELATAIDEADTQDAITALGAVHPSMLENESDVLGSIDTQDLRVVRVIDGKILESLTPWLKRVPHLKREEIRSSILNNSVENLILRSAARSNTLFMIKTAKKQFFKYVLVIGGFAGMSHMLNMNLPSWLDFSAVKHQIVPSMHQSKHSKVPPITKTITLSQEQLNAISRRVLVESSLNNAAVNSVVKTSPAVSISSEALTAQINELSLAEIRAGGKPIIYSETLPSASQSPDAKTALGQLRSQTTNGYLIASFQKQSTIEVVPIAQQGMQTISEVITIKNGEQPQAYAALTHLVAVKTAPQAPQQSTESAAPQAK